MSKPDYFDNDSGPNPGLSSTGHHNPAYDIDDTQRHTRPKPVADKSAEGGRLTRYFDKPLARVSAAVALIGAILGLVATWPQDLWPRSVPAVTMTTIGEPNSGPVYVVPIGANNLQGAPSPNTDEGCGSKARHDWILSIGGVPFRYQEISVIVTSLRKDTAVVIAEVRPHVRKLPKNPQTLVAPCPDDVGLGGPQCCLVRRRLAG
jgi:hypothetical protein